MQLNMMSHNSREVLKKQKKKHNKHSKVEENKKKVYKRPF